jgi:hypothetical protein
MCRVSLPLPPGLFRKHLHVDAIMPLIITDLHYGESMSGGQPDQ